MKGIIFPFRRVDDEIMKRSKIGLNISIIDELSLQITMNNDYAPI